ncbi:MAG: histidinol dehydrogenase [Phycisphaerae bacterium]|nr:histidinol dehydrogenase [Phycisphaerae bacterium]
MSVIKIIDAADRAGREELAALRAALARTDVMIGRSAEAESVQQVIEAVRERGDAALVELAERFDRATLMPETLRVSAEELSEARARLDPSLAKAIRHAIDNVRRFQEHILIRGSEPLLVEGARLQIRFRPLHRVAVCVPGASAPLPSTAIHTVVPAQVAGVREIAMFAPPRWENTIHPVTAATAAELGLTEVYRLGTAQGVAALGLGTESIRQVEKIVGPGSVYSQLAKKQLFGVIDIESFAGPSEIIIIADGSASAEYVAADLLGQAEHAPGSAILMTPDRDLAAGVEQALRRQLERLSRSEQTAACLREYGAIVLVEDLSQAAELAEEFAPEHLTIETEDPESLADRIDSAGAIFMGHLSPEALGDYVAGPSHVLPTGGSARFFSGLSCLDFLRRTSLIRYERAGLDRDAGAAIALAEAEGLDAHANSVRVRLGGE